MAIVRRSGVAAFVPRSTGVVKAAGLPGATAHDRAMAAQAARVPRLANIVLASQALGKGKGAAVRATRR